MYIEYIDTVYKYMYETNNLNLINNKNNIYIHLRFISQMPINE